LTLPNGSPLPLAKLEKFAVHSWQFRGWKWVDPLKDMQAAEAELALNITSHSRLSSEAGRDFEETLAEKKRDQEVASRYGVSLALPSNQPPQNSPPPAADE
jgi:capsid protein